ncbi:unnamed protein product [Mytilus edulis]|uniref:Uncharacterized protein n=1 Tax=Mytilus edulis TaxID=6550 RepID=A0A8S3T7K4_MYTED|nr:unnamed protein product [Mytilus edulis]
MQASKDVQDFLLKSRERGNQMVKSAVEGCVNESEPRVFYSPISKSPLNTFNDMTKTSKLKCTSEDLERLRFGKGPMQTVIDCDRIAVTYGYKQFIETLDSHDFRVLQTFRPQEDCFGITHQNEKLYVVGKDKIFVLDLSGWKQIVLVIEHATYIAVFEDKLFYTNRNTNLVHCSNMNGQDLWQFRDRVIIHPTGIAIDLNQNVFVVGHWSNNLSVIGNSGKDCNTLLSEGKGLSQPHAICYDKHINTLLLCDKLSGNCALYDVS